MSALPEFNPPSVWEIAADDVLSVIIREPEAYKYARFEGGLLPMLMPEKYRPALQAVYSLYENGEPIHDTLIIARSGGKVDIAWINQVMALYDATRARRDVFRKNVEIVTDEGLRAGKRHLLSIADQQLARGNKHHSEVTKNLVMVLEGLGSAKHIYNVMAKDHGMQYAVRLMQNPIPARSTGIGWLDDLTGGYLPANLWWIVGAYKSRKTTVLLNMALGAALSGEKPAILSREMTQEQVYWQLVSMLAVGLLKQRGFSNTVHTTQDGNRIPLMALSPVGLMLAYNGYKRWPAEKVRAIDDAIDLYQSLPLRVYDSKPEHGNLSTIQTLEDCVLYDLEKFGGTLFYADYIQLFSTPGEMNTAQSEELKANTVQNICKRRDTTIVCVAQQNEAGVRGEGGYSPNVAGGGAVPKTANALITTKYKATEDSADSELTLTMKLARNAASRTNETFAIHPATGLIDGQSWLGRLK